MIKEIFDRLSSYNLFNYLLPGVLFAAIGKKMTGFDLVYDDIVIGLFIYYFYGLVISRLGSLIIEPVFKAIHFVQFASYHDFISASEVDSKLDQLSEVNNMYRTLCSLFISLVALYGIHIMEEKCQISREKLLIIGMVALLALFASAYKKQTVYITKRIAKCTAQLTTKSSEE
jgi:hypothetical protein